MKNSPHTPPNTSSAQAAFYRAIQAERQKRKQEALRFDWAAHGRPDQQIPTARPWINWLILAGRGWGTTRTSAETVRQWIRHYPYVNLIGATTDDARDIMIEGESGILAICPKDERPRYLSQKRRLEWPNGAKSLIFTADEPERLRGKQHMKLWCDELCAWRYTDAWDQASLGLRLGNNPQAVITTTPKPTKQLKELVADPLTFITKGSTNDNRANLAEAFIHKIIKKYEGTRLGRQELSAEILDDNPGALWKRSQIDKLRVKEAPAMKRIVVAIDQCHLDKGLGERIDKTK
jgi:phage terminase large subunit-like protein